MQSKYSIARLWQIRRAVRENHIVDLIHQLKLSKKAKLTVRLLFGSPQPSDTPRGVRIRQCLESLGPVFIKLGQALSTRPDVVPYDIAEELTKLQDKVPPFDGEHAIDLIKQNFGDEFSAIFESIETEPLASASVAQVHAATLKSDLALEGKNGKRNSEVVVKIIRPDVHQKIQSDLSVMHLFASMLERNWRRADQFKPQQIIDDYQATILGELDLQLEAANCSQMAANFADTDIAYVPTVYWDYTSQNVMVMERIYGTSIRDIEQLKEQGVDLKRLAEDGVETFFKQAFVDNFFHADMHPGNIFVSEEGKWIAIDFGIMGVLNERDKRYLAEMLLAFFNRDYSAIANIHLRAGWVPSDIQMTEFEAAIRMVCEPNFAKPISEISFGKVLIQLFYTVQRFKMPVQPQLILLYKTLLNIEGLGRQLYPQLNLWDTAKPFLENWMKEQLSPQTLFNDFKNDWPQWRAVLKDAPNFFAQQIEAQQNQAQPIKTKKSKTSFHSTLGFGVGFIGLTVVLASLGNLIPSSNLTQIAPFLSAAGFCWAYVNSC